MKNQKNKGSNEPPVMKNIGLGVTFGERIIVERNGRKFTINLVVQPWDQEEIMDDGLLTEIFVFKKNLLKLYEQPNTRGE